MHDILPYPDKVISFQLITFTFIGKVTDWGLTLPAPCIVKAAIAAMGGVKYGAGMDFLDKKVPIKSALCCMFIGSFKSLVLTRSPCSERISIQTRTQIDNGERCMPERYKNSFCSLPRLKISCNVFFFHFAWRLEEGRTVCTEG